MADTETAHTDIDNLAASVIDGRRSALAAALNLLDDRRPHRRRDAADLLSRLAGRRPARDNRLIGMTGPPGVGKSSLGAALIGVWRSRDLRVGVLAVDPSSPVSGGALLGDRLRMKTDDNDDGVFIRSLSSRGEYGGLSAEVWPMSLVMLAACDVVLVETVGVGQREADIAMSCDTTCFVAQPGSGDTIQFLKAGILEVPHVLVVNKHDMGQIASRTLSELSGAIAAEHPDGNWQVPVLATSANQQIDVEELADVLEELSITSRQLGRGLLPMRVRGVIGSLGPAAPAGDVRSLRPGRPGRRRQAVGRTRTETGEPFGAIRTLRRLVDEHSNRQESVYAQSPKLPAAPRTGRP
ncbi:MAG: hypothetical protein U5K56_01140 [Halioglobus sp.]|nr:hypothetical protein [Halioglobus sp.]